MRHFKGIYWLLLLSVPLFTLGGCGNSSPVKNATDAVSDAYIFSFPLVTMSVTMQNATNTVEGTSKKAPINQLHHAAALASAGFREVVTPNVDTLYSQAFIDLKDGPLVFVKPASDRYCSAQFLDSWTNSVGIAGSGGTGDGYAEQVWILLRQDDSDTVVPTGMREARFSGNLGWIICRTLCMGEDDLTNVQAIQERMRLLPLTAYLAGGTYVPPAGTYDPQYDYVPVERVVGMSPEEFFKEANRLMVDNPPVSDDKTMVETIGSVGVGPGLSFDVSILGSDESSVAATWKDLMSKVNKRVAESSQKFFVHWGPWQYLGEPIAEFGTEYDYRAMVALKGLGANPVSAAIYASANKDSDGVPLKAGSHYRVHFEKGALPPVLEDGFRSITAYGDDNFLIPNSLNRYSISDRTPLVFNSDGSLDLLLQPEAPQDDDPLRANWLPTGSGGFHLFLRLYCPDRNRVGVDWEAPSIVENGTNVPTANPYLSSALYGITHFDPSQSDSTPYGPPKGTFSVDPTGKPISRGGPINIITLATTSLSHMWGIGSDRVSYIEVTGDDWTEVTRIDAPAYLVDDLGPIDPSVHKSVGEMVFEGKTSSDVDRILAENYGEKYPHRLANGVYSAVDRDNVLYATFGYGVYAFALKDKNDPSAGIEIIHRIDNAAKEIQGPTSNAILYGLTMTYDGFLVINFSNGVAVLDRSLNTATAQKVLFDKENTGNSIAIDENNGIYVVTDKKMHKLVWTGTKLSQEETDGAWTSPYDAPEDAVPPIVKFDAGSGSTPTLMGFGEGEDRLVVITDGCKRMNLVAFWRDKIPSDASQQPGTASNRIAGQIPVTCGLDPLPNWIQSEQSVVVNGYGAFVVNNMPIDSDNMARLSKILGAATLGPVYPPSKGVERFRWDTESNRWESVWSRGDVSSTSMIPVHCRTGNMAVVSGYGENGWEITGMDWYTGKTVHRTMLGKTNYGNGSYAIIQYMPDGDLLFNSLVGPYRVSYTN